MILIAGFPVVWLLFASAAFAMMVRAGRARSNGRMTGFLAGAGAAIAALIVVFNAFWAVLGQLDDPFGGSRSTPIAWWPLLLIYSVWATVLVLGRRRRASA